MAEFQKVAENLERREPSGLYYLRATIAGKLIRRALKTDHLGTAKKRRDAKLVELRANLGAGTDSIPGALAAEALRLSRLPDRKKSTRHYHDQTIALLRETLPGGRDWSVSAAEAWWSKLCTRYSAARCNAALSSARRVAASMVAGGTWSNDPTAGLERAKVRSKPPSVPSPAEVEIILAAMRDSRAGESAAMAEFLVWSGLRVAELRGLRWEDINGEWLTVTGGERGTKNRKTRRIPIFPPLRPLIERLRYQGATGPVFSIQSPRFALNRATKRLGLPHLRVHDLRHIFATRCIEAGIDIPTLSRFLGHSDGGALAMKTYGHLRDEHALSQALLLG